MDIGTKTEKPNKPLKFLQGMKSAGSSNTDTTSETPDESSLEQKKNENKNKEEQPENIMKVGFGKALTGFKNMRANRPSKVQDEESENKTEKGKDVNVEKNNKQRSFDFRKINLSRKNNIF